MNQTAIDNPAASSETPLPQTLEAQFALAQRQLDDLRQQLTETQRLATIGTIAAVIAHEFNNLLTPIVSYSQYALGSAQSQQPDMELIKKALTKSFGSAEKAGKICASMLSLARGQQSDGRVNVQKLVDEVLLVLARDPQKDGIALRVQIEPDLEIAGDQVQLEQVLLNLLINARQAMLGRGGTLTIRAAVDAVTKQARLQVSDTGSGIPERFLPKIFQPFFTTKGTAPTGEVRGTGLGLAICQQIVQRHGGVIQVESQVGKGATFTVWLPIGEVCGMFHLLDSHADFQLRSMATAVAGESAITVGRGGRLRDTWAAARFLRARRGSVHAWGNRGLIAAALAGASPIVYTPPVEMSARAWKWAAWISRRRDMTVVCPAEPVRNALCRSGIAPDRCRLIRPGAASVTDTVPGLRYELGLSDSDFVVLAPGDSTRAADHNLGLWAAAIAHELDPSWKLLVWGHGPLAAQVRRMGKKMNPPELLHFARRWDFAQLTSAADAAIFTGLGGPTLGMAICMAAGLPVVRANGDRTASSLSRKLIALRADPARRAALALQEKADAEKLFSFDQFLELHRALYAELGISS